MSDPLSVTASLVGVVGALLHGSRRLFEFIDSLRNAPKDIATLSADLRALYEVLAQLTSMQERLSGNPDLCSSLKAPLENCLDIFDEFTTLLQGFTHTSRDGSIKVRTWKNIVWAFKDKEIQLFRDTITTYKVSLDMAVNSMAFSTITSIEERTRRFETDFKEEFRYIKSKLRALDVDRVELASIAGSKGSEWYGTEADFALNRFLDYTGSLCASPPGSYPASPTLPASESYFDIETSGGTLDSMSELQEDANTAPLPSLQGVHDRNQPMEKLSVESTFSESGFDLLALLWRVTTRKNPKIKLGAVDMSCSFVICDTTLNDCPVVYVSDQFQKLTGYSRSEVQGRNCRFLQAPDGKVEAGSNREFVEKNAVYNLKKNLQERKEYQQSLINYRKGGQPFLNLLTIIPIPSDLDEVRYYIGLQADLVESPDVINQLGESGETMVDYRHSDMGQYIWTLLTLTQSNQENDKEFHVDDLSILLQQLKPHHLGSAWYKNSWNLMLLQNTDDLIYILSPENTFLYLSPACKKILEYDNADLLGSPLSSVCHPSDIELVRHELSGKATYDQINIIFRIRRKSSGYLWFESCGSVSVEPNTGHRYLTLIGRPYPIYALSRLELEIKGGISDRELWTKISISGIFLFVPSVVQELLDLRPETLIGTRIQDLIPKKTRSNFTHILKSAREDKPVSSISFWHELQTFKGQILQVQTILYPCRPFPGSKPAFLLAQTKLSPSPPGSKSKSSQNNSLEFDENVFSELTAYKMSDWQSELRRLEEQNRVLAKDLDRLLLKRAKRGQTSNKGSLSRQTDLKTVPLRTKRSFDQLNQ